MDHTAITHLSLCAGYGGIDLGLRSCIPNLRTIAYSEVEAFAIELLLARMEGGQIDAAPIWPDVRSFPWEQFRERVDILSGGYPCQPFSAAGKRLGREDERHIWPYIADGIRILQPALCFLENVEGHITLGLRDVLDDLGRLGYRATWGIFSASEVGAPHQRKRVFIVAHRSGAGLEGLTGDGERAGRQSLGSSGSTSEGSLPSLWPSLPGQPQLGWEPPRVVGNAASTEWRADDLWGEGQTIKTSGAFAAPDRRKTQPALGRNADGPAGGLDYAQLCVAGDSRVDELRLLGNGVVPATAARAFRVLLTDLFQ